MEGIYSTGYGGTFFHMDACAVKCPFFCGLLHALFHHHFFPPRWKTSFLADFALGHFFLVWSSIKQGCFNVSPSEKLIKVGDFPCNYCTFTTKVKPVFALINIVLFGFLPEEMESITVWDCADCKFSMARKTLAGQRISHRPEKYFSGRFLRAPGEIFLGIIFLFGRPRK